MDEPTLSDIADATETYNEMMQDLDSYDGPELIVTSQGYAQVWSDGEVTVHNSTWFQVDEDGLSE